MDTKRALLASAERLIRQRGYDAVSFGDLAQAIGIRTASIHYHFPKKADLAAGVLDIYAAKLERQRGNIAMNAASGGAAIASLVALYRAALNEGRQLCLCVAFAAGRESLPEDVRRQLERFHAESRDWLERAFSRAREDRSMRGVTDPAAEAAACLALLEGAQIMARAAGGLEPFDAATSALRQRIEGEMR